jgi:hypothetical protein
MSKSDQSFPDVFHENGADFLHQPPRAGYNLPENVYNPQVTPDLEVLQTLRFGCRRNGGIHISWLHYTALYAIVCFLSVVITIWTTVALHRMDPTIHVNGFQLPSQEHWPAEPARPPSNEINISPHIVVGGLMPNEQTVTTVITTIVTLESSKSPTTFAETQPTMVTILSRPTVDTSGFGSSTQSTLPEDLKPIVDISGQGFVDRSQNSSSSSLSQPIPMNMETTTVTDMKTASPAFPTVAPSTRYFNPPTSQKTAPIPRLSKWEAIGGGVQ